VRGHNSFTKYGGGISSPSILSHGGMGGTVSWIDPSTGVVAAYIELATEMDETSFCRSWIGHKVEAVVTSAVLDD
jgi:hypothetical protein